MYIDSIENGIVLDHITAGRGMRVYETLGLDALDCTVAILKNVPSGKMKKKDIIKIGTEVSLDSIDFDALGYVDPGITVNRIAGGKCVEKRHLSRPTVLRGVIHCKNPRCITSTEQELAHVFRLCGEGEGEYRCLYCDTPAEK
ncbi:MAG: aspartate carbamoyltransferase regulatory subunit [Eubacteriales bacterium]|jgi:aspartate carbamoyltransferase regulatory chain, allosteric domain|nr:aspartate carbamoyltransferase regulatory subunit [Clostridiales bacterium]MDD7774686.1 aspartate carbamoyltransferase regulatory subunit [Eubacteriales bacterium]MDY3940987.1 aspartate carbamoyltransferase regulatory subunit [Eubacteriales bacterium]